MKNGKIKLIVCCYCEKECCVVCVDSSPATTSEVVC